VRLVLVLPEHHGLPPLHQLFHPGLTVLQGLPLRATRMQPRGTKLPGITMIRKVVYPANARGYHERFSYLMVSSAKAASEGNMNATQRNLPVMLANGF
jgi:hypothetical protein